MRETSRSTVLLFLICAIPVALMLGFTERAVATGHTDLSRRPGDNYGVLQKSRCIYITTTLAPMRIMERDGKLVRSNTVLNRVLPVTTYSPATPEEEALWRQHFS